MKKLILIILPLLFLSAGLAFAVSASGNQSQTTEKGEVMTKKVLVSYFSWGGNTKHIAELIHSQTGGDMFSIEPVTPYPSDYNETAYGVAKEQKDKGIHPPIKNKDISSYDVIFVGTPAWWYTMAPPVMTFLAENNFEGKTIIPFITHGGGGAYTIAADMGKLAKGAKVLTPFVVYERGDSNTAQKITEWLKELAY